jgi:hypothetical protein
MFEGLNNLLQNKDFLYMLANTGTALSQKGENPVGVALGQQVMGKIRSDNYKDLIGAIVGGGGTFKIDGKGTTINMPNPAPQTGGPSPSPSGLGSVASVSNANPNTLMPQGSFPGVQVPAGATPGINGGVPGAAPGTGLDPRILGALLGGGGSFFR